MTILITGTSSGIGKVVGDYLSSKGYDVIGTSRKPKSQKEAYPQLKLDITDDESVRLLLKKIEDDYGKVDVLINNAGIALAGSIEDTSITEAQDQFDTNYFGPLRMIRAFLPMMKTRGEGKIINISSLASEIALPFQPHYTASKFALEGLVEALRMEVKQFNIKVMNINPGDFKTELTANRLFAAHLSNDYQDNFDFVMKYCEDNEQTGSDPIKIAHLVERLINKKSGFKIRYFVGKTSQTFLVPLKRILGSSILEKLLIREFKL